mmetsp:Transcript_15145/g.24118  ORF Transcript_15145/g.24118 Transcript_15145/m.24118 type:complete len:153 (+) Transcript_15145:1396-1854(+)
MDMVSKWSIITVVSNCKGQHPHARLAQNGNVAATLMMWSAQSPRKRSASGSVFAKKEPSAAAPFVGGLFNKTALTIYTIVVGHFYSHKCNHFEIQISCSSKSFKYHKYTSSIRTHALVCCCRSLRLALSTPTGRYYSSPYIFLPQLPHEIEQ